MTRPELPHLKSDEPLADMIEAIKESGGVIVEGLLADEAVGALVDEVAPFVVEADVDMGHLNPGVQMFFAGVKNVTGLAAKSPTFVNSMLLNPILLGLADSILAPSCSEYSLNVGHLLEREPGSERQFLHRDEDVWIHLVHLVEGPEQRPVFELASVTALTEFTEGNGATVVVPGSHRWERGRQPQESELAFAEMPAGAAVIYLGSTIHAGGTNKSEASRVGIHLSYVAGWLRSEENNVLAVPPDIARRLPRRAQELIGYQVHDAIDLAGGYLGAVDLRNPVDMLADGEL